jgi:hypothetical protein
VALSTPILPYSEFVVGARPLWRILSSSLHELVVASLISVQPDPCEMLRIAT